MRNKILPLLSFVLFLICISCSSANREVTVLVFNSELEGKVLKIDGNVIELSDTQYTNLRLTKGIHRIESEGLFPDSIRITESGLMASGNTRFAKMPIVFGTKNSVISQLNQYPTGPILIKDSLIVYDKKQFKTQEALIARLKKTLAKKPEDRVFDFRLSELVPDNNGFIKKDWNYDISSVPESISVDSETGWTERSVILDFQLLELYCLLEDEFEIEAVENDEDLVTVMQYVGIRDQPF